MCLFFGLLIHKLIFVLRERYLKVIQDHVNDVHFLGVNHHDAHSGSLLFESFDNFFLQRIGRGVLSDPNVLFFTLKIFALLLHFWILRKGHHAHFYRGFWLGVLLISDSDVNTFDFPTIDVFNFLLRLNLIVIEQLNFSNNIVKS